MLRTFKNYLRRRRLTRRGIGPRLELPQWTSGARSGMWTIWPEPLNSESVVYSFGVGDNLAWELALIRRCGLTVHAFDPTPASVAWVGLQSLPDNLRFHAVGLAGYDGDMTFTLPSRGSRFNFRPTSDESAASDAVVAPVRRLSSHLASLGHRRIDVLKIDIEGGEYDSLEELYDGRIDAKQLCIEFHHHFPGVGLRRTEEAVRKLRDVGYEILHMSPRGLEMTFVRDAA